MAKRAVLIGCNYPGTKAELHGCVNDVSRMYKSLVDRFGFSEDDITVLVDNDKRSVQPTGVNIKKVLARVVQQSTAGDIFVLHYSGHGTQVPAESGDDEDDGLDEAIVPTDLNLMTDNDFRTIFKDMQPGVNFTFISDSCHSGGLLDQEEEQIGAGDEGAREFAAPVPAQSRGYGGGGSRSYEQQSGEYGERYGQRSYGDRHQQSGEYGERYGQREYRGYGGRREEPEYREERHGHHHGRREEEPGYGEYEEPRAGRYGHEEHGHRNGRRDEGHEYEQRRVPFANKSLSIETLSEMLSQRAGHEVKPGNIRTSLYDIFGDDASPTVKVFVNLIANKLSGGEGGQGGGGHGGVWGVVGGLAMDFMNAKLNESGGSNYAGAAQMVSNVVSQSGHAGSKPPRSQRLSKDVGILVSGCQSNETSADANPSGDPKQAYGALSNGIQSVLAQTRGPITNAQLVTEVRALLKKQGFSQHPCLYSSDAKVNDVFICE